MKKNVFRLAIIVLVFNLLIHTNTYSQKSEILDNDGVIELVNSGLPNSIIIKKIQTSPNRFDLSTDGLIKLTNAKVPEEILNIMIDSDKNKVSDYYEIIKKLDKPGIYLLKDNQITSDFTLIEPTVIDKIKEGSFGSHMAGALTSAAKNNIKAIISNEKANNRANNNPVFLFYFGQDDQKKAEAKPQDNQYQNNPFAMAMAMQQGGMIATKKEFSSINSPNEIRLVKSVVKSKQRTFVASSSSGMTQESGIDSDYIHDFKFEKLSSGLYKVYFERPIEIGEYLFVFAGIRLDKGQYVYDFSVQ